MTVTMAYGYSSESTQRELSNEYQHDRVYNVFKTICVRILWTNVALALEALTSTFVKHPKHIYILFLPKPHQISHTKYFFLHNFQLSSLWLLFLPTFTWEKCMIQRQLQRNTNIQWIVCVSGYSLHDYWYQIANQNLDETTQATIFSYSFECRYVCMYIYWL